jgi:hypothetical protein
VAVLEAMLEDDPFNATALLGLGTYARHLRDEGKAEAAAAIGQLLVETLGRAKRPLERMHSLQAIANSGYAPALPAVLPFLRAPEETERANAVRAIQSMRDPSVDALIASPLASDPATNVRLSAIEAARVREPSDVLAHALESAATDAPDAHVRYRAVELVVQWMKQRPDFRATLERVARTDQEATVRDRAKAAL